MPNTKEKLVELIGQVQDEGCDYSNCLDRYDKPDYIENSTLADHLIAHGVTVQECKGVEIDPFNKWISVKDRLPDMRHDVLVSETWWNEPKPAQIGWYNEETGNWYILTEDGYFINYRVTHWMPLPQPPKGE